MPDKKPKYQTLPGVIINAKRKYKTLPGITVNAKTKKKASSTTDWKMTPSRNVSESTSPASTRLKQNIELENDVDQYKRMNRDGLKEISKEDFNNIPERDTRSWWSDSRAKERGDAFWNGTKKVTAVGQFSPEPVSRYSSIALNSLMGAADTYFSIEDGDLTNAKINAIGAIPLPGYGSIKALKNVPGLSNRQKLSILKTSLSTLGVDLFGTVADLTDNFGLEQQKNGGTSSKTVTCTCGHSWDKSDSSKKDATVCHICGKNNMKDGGWLDKYQDDITPAKAQKGNKVIIDGKEYDTDSNEYRNMLDKGQVGTMKDDVWYGNKSELQPVTIYSSKDKNTQKFYDRLKDENGLTTYESLLKLGAKYGAPHVTIKDKPGFFDPKYTNYPDRVRPHYDPLSQNITLGNDPYTWYDEYISELAHQKQLMNKGALDFVMRGVENFPRIVKNKIDPNKKGYNEEYDIPGSIEYEAHKKIEPELIKEFDDIWYKKSYEGDYYEKPGTFSSSKPNATFKSGGWLDKYGKEINANEGRSSAPENWVGEGYSNVGRNYSPAWGGQFAMGGSLPGSVGFTYARTQDAAPVNGPYAKKTKASAENGMTYYQHGLDWKPKSISKNGGWLEKYVPEAQTGFELATGIKPITSMTNATDVIGKTEPERLKEKTKGEDIHRQNVAEKKRQFVGQGKASTKESEAERKRKNKAYAANLSNGKYNEQTGEIERINPNRSITGEAENFMSRREDKAGEHILGALEAAGYAEGLGALGSAAKKALAQSMESGLLSNAYKLNPWAFKVNPEAGYRMIGGKEEYLDAITSGQIRPTGAYEHAHFNIGQPLNPNRLSAEELIQAGSPGGYKGPYMAEMKQGTWQRMSDAFPNNPEMQEQLRLLGKDKDVWQHPLFGNIKVDDTRLKLYKEDWLKGYKKVPTSTNSSSYPSFKSITGNPEYIDQEHLSKLIKRETDWLRSPEYLKRKMLSTGRSEASIKKESENIINHVNNTSVNYTGTLEGDVSGLYSSGRNPKIQIFDGVADYPFYEGVLDHEVKHAFSETATQGDPILDYITNKGYKNYPKVNLNKTVGDRVSSMFGQNWSNLAPEQQVTGRKMMDIIEETQGLKRGTELTEDNVKGLIDHLKKGERWETSGYDDVLTVMSDYKRKFGKGYSKQLTDFINKAYVLPGIGVAGAAAIASQPEQKKQGGIIEDNRGQWAHPGKITKINSNQITMKGVDYPVLGISDEDDIQMMYPGEEYKFKGKKVTEFPITQKVNKKETGGWLSQYK